MNQLELPHHVKQQEKDFLHSSSIKAASKDTEKIKPPFQFPSQ